MEPPILNEMGLKYGTDKADSNHNYLRAYQGLFEHIASRVESVLEIGVWEGASIRMWLDYFGSATVTGYDIDLSRCKGLEHPQLQLHELDAYSGPTVGFTPVQDVIIDDGPHTLDSMLFSAAYYAPLVRDGGIFVIEDVKYLDWCAELTDALPEHLRHLSYTIDCRTTATSETHDDILFVVDRRYE